MVALAEPERHCDATHLRSAYLLSHSITQSTWYQPRKSIHNYPSDNGRKCSAIRNIRIDRPCHLPYEQRHRKRLLPYAWERPSKTEFHPSYLDASLIKPCYKVIAPNLIIFRIANGISFTSEITHPTESTNIKFASRKPTMLPSRDESHTQIGTGYSQPSTSEKKRTISSSSQENSIQTV